MPRKTKIEIVFLESDNPDNDEQWKRHLRFELEHIMNCMNPYNQKKIKIFLTNLKKGEKDSDFDSVDMDELFKGVVW